MIAQKEKIDYVPCDFCEGQAGFKDAYDKWGIRYGSEGVDGAGSDWVAIWCGDCGPKHRKESGQ